MLKIIIGKINQLMPRWLLISAIIFFIMLAAATAGLLALDKIYQNKIYPHVFVGGLNLSGQTMAAAEKLLNQEVDQISQRGIIFSYKNYQLPLRPVVASPDGDLAYQLINFNVEATITQALDFGRSHNFWLNLKNKLLLLFMKKRLPLAVSASQAQLEKILADNFSPELEPAQDAGLMIKKTADGRYEFSLSGEKYGKTIDYQAAISLMLNNLAKLNAAEIKLSTITQYPKILAQDCLNIDSQAEAILAAAPLTLRYGENKWVIEQSQLAELLALKPNNSNLDKVKVGLNEEKINAYLTEKIASEINIKPLEAKFTVKNGKVSEFQNGQDGLELELTASAAKIENEILTGQPIDLIVKVQPVLINAGDINNYGIKEIAGVGTSNFAGSPANRRHNIGVGASAINGILIKPGEEFSLLKTLGEVSSATGYLPELVIKDNKTTPEFGGGLCQIGTTMFRAALATGLPITLRHNHSYRVGYYEPAGTDATIYDPWPDFRFINDLPTYVLIQSKISGDNLSFEFWSTRDGRVVEQTKSVIYNIVKPEPAKIIETLDLKPGEKKCTEHAHNGADAYFDYKVTYPDGQVKQKRFSSHYVPWQEVCLLGVETLSAPPDTATSTPIN